MWSFLKLHGIKISLSTVKRRLQTLGLSRKPDNIPNDELKQVIERERSVEVVALLAIADSGPDSEERDILSRDQES